MEPRDQRVTAETMPVVWIYKALPTDKECETAILLGLEEEGIPCEVKEVPGGSAHSLAAEAAKASSLGVGIGLVGKNSEAALHHRDLPGDERLIELNGEEFGAECLRRLGANAARFVKGVPLIPLVEQEYPLESEPFSPGGTPAHSAPSAQASDAIDLETLTRIVVEVVEKLNSSKVDK